MAAEQQVDVAAGGAPGRLSRLLRSNVGYGLLFACAFLAGWIPVLAVLAQAGSSFFWEVDGLSQQYVWFVYTGQWLREAFSTLVVDHSLALPLWTWDSGFGADVVQSLLCTAINPFYAVAAFVPEAWAEYVFEAVMLVELYAAGLTFSAWAIHKGCSRSGAFVGAIAYVFAGNAVVVFSQPGFLFPVLVFPLVLLGADRIFERGRSLLFVAMMAWTFAFSFYDAYMMCLLLVLYCLGMFWWQVDAHEPRQGRLRRLGRWTLVFVGHVLLSACVAAILFVPQAASLAGSGRLELERSWALTYTPNFYINFLLGFTSYSFVGGDAYSGFNVLVVLALVLVAMRRKQHPFLLAAFCVLTIMMLVPLFGRLMNAGQYPTDRWSWAYGLCAAYALARLLPDLLRLAGRERCLMAIVVMAYGLLCLVLPVPGRVKIAAAVLLVACAVCLGARRLGEHRAVVVLAVCAVTAGSVAFCWYVAPGLGNKVAELVPAGECWERHRSLGAAELIDEVSSFDGSYRVDRAPHTAHRVHNAGLIGGYLSPDLYNSIYNDGIDELLTSLGLPDTEGTNNRYGSLSGRAALEALCAVGYYYVGDSEAGVMPVTFRDGELLAQGIVQGDTYGLYATDVVLPLAYTTNAYLSKTAYLELPVVDRATALLQAVVLDDGVAPAGCIDLGEKIQASSVSVPAEVVEADGCIVGDHEVTVFEKGARLRLSLDPVADAETYLVISSMDYRPLGLGDRFDTATWETMGLVERLKAQVAQLAAPVLTNGSFEVWGNGEAPAVNVYYPNADDPIYGGVRDWVCNLGYSAEGHVEATVVFGAPGVYSFASASVIAQPMEPVLEAIEACQQGAARHLELGANRLSCQVAPQADGLTLFSVGFSDGWSATVDGEPAEILRADLGFMAVWVPAGEHTVELVYATPLLAEGAVLTVVGLGACVVVFGVLPRRRRRRENAD